MNPLFERALMGRHIFLFKDSDRAALETIGELHTPSVADLFVATMKGGQS